MLEIVSDVDVDNSGTKQLLYEKCASMLGYFFTFRKEPMSPRN